MKRNRGFSLLELCLAIAILGIIVLVAVPAFGTYRRRNAVISAADEIRSTLRLVRSRALANGRHFGVKFGQNASGVWTSTLYRDGDNDGVRNDDIAKGVDTPIGPSAPLMPQLHVAKIGLLPVAIKDPDGDPLPPTAAAVDFNRTTICSFSPIGGATPGSIYMVDGTGVLYCVRVHGANGRVRLMRYDAGRRKWEQR